MAERRLALRGRVLADVAARTLTVVDDELARTVARDLRRLYGLLMRELAAVRLDRGQVGVVEAGLSTMSSERRRGRPIPSLADATELALTRGTLVNGANTVELLATLRGLGADQTLAVPDAGERLGRAAHHTDDAGRRRILAEFGEPDAPPEPAPAPPLPDGPIDRLRELVLVAPPAGPPECGARKAPRPMVAVGPAGGSVTARWERGRPAEAGPLHAGGHHPAMAAGCGPRTPSPGAGW